MTLAKNLKIGDRFYDLDGDLSEYIGHEREIPVGGDDVYCGFYNTIKEDGRVLLPYIPLLPTTEIRRA